MNETAEYQISCRQTGWHNSYRGVVTTPGGKVLETHPRTGKGAKAASLEAAARLADFDRKYESALKFLRASHDVRPGPSFHCGETRGPGVERLSVDGELVTRVGLIMVAKQHGWKPEETSRA